MTLELQMLICLSIRLSVCPSVCYQNLSDLRYQVYLISDVSDLYDYCAYRPSCLLAMMPISCCAYWPLCLLAIMPFSHRAYQPTGLIGHCTIMLLTISFLSSSYNLDISFLNKHLAIFLSSCMDILSVATIP